MVLRRIYRRIVRPFEKKRRPRKAQKKLKKPQRHQADKPPVDGKCLLLELPAEVRLRILEYTLCSDEPIQARQNFESKISYDNYYYDYDNSLEYDNWPQGRPCLSVLSTCRQLYQEGSDVFYNRNTFSITICDPGYGAYGNVDMLGMGSPQTVFSTHDRFRTCPNLKFYLFFARVVNCNTLGYSTHKDAIDEAVEQIYQSWQGHGKIEVEVSQQGRLWVDHPIGASAMLHKFGLFRCNSVSFQGVPRSIAYRLTRLMESEQPVVDLQQAFRSLTMFLESTWIRDDSQEIGYGELHSDAERLAAAYDVENFMLLRKRVVDAALEKMKAGHDRVQERGAQLKDEAIVTRTQGGLSEENRQLNALLSGL